MPTQYLAPSIGAHLSGDFVGTTDEIIQWAACKWGIEADVVRAQAAQESSWFMTSTGDYTTDSTWCAPGHSPGSDGRSGCPESVGLMGDKYRYHEIAFPEAGQSTAHNLDYALAVWRDCFEGNQTWLGDDNSGYHAGDMWGCVGRWYAAAWRDGMASGYISRVQAKYNDRVWETGAFKSLSSPASSG